MQNKHEIKNLENASYCIVLKPPAIFVASKSSGDLHFKLPGKPLNTVLSTKGFKDWPVVKDILNKAIDAGGWGRRKKKKKKEERSEMLS